MSATSMNGFNPYACYVNPYMNYGMGYNDDFMYNASNNPYAQQQALMQQYAFQGYQQPPVDTYQSSQGSSALGTGLKLGVVGGIGAGAGAYFFGDKLGASFTKDGKTFTDDILKAYETAPKEIADTKVAAERVRIIENKFANVKEYEAIEKFVTTPAAERANLPKAVTDLVPDAVKQNPQAYEQTLFQTQTAINNIDKAGILKQAQQGNLAFQTEELANLAKRKSLVEGLAKDATPAQIEELITKNSKVFGIEKTVEAEIQAEAKAIAQRYGTKAGALAEVTPLLTDAENSVKNLRTTLNGQVAAHWDDAAKAFRADAPEALTKAAKSFKWSKAGKYGAIVAGAGLLLGCLFGGKS